MPSAKPWLVIASINPQQHTSPLRHPIFLKQIFASTCFWGREGRKETKGLYASKRPLKDQSLDLILPQQALVNFTSWWSERCMPLRLSSPAEILLWLCTRSTQRPPVVRTFLRDSLLASLVPSGEMPSSLGRQRGITKEVYKRFEQGSQIKSVAR
jgi:hypothetical protein